MRVTASRNGRMLKHTVQIREHQITVDEQDHLNGGE